MALCWFKAKHLKTFHSSPSWLPFSAFLRLNKGLFCSSKHSKHIFLVLFKAPIHLRWGKICMRVCDLYDYHHNMPLPGMLVGGQMRWALFWSSLKVGSGAVCLLLIVWDSRLGSLGIPVTDGPKLWPERCASGIQPAASPIHSLVSFPTQFLSLSAFVFANSLSFSSSASHFSHLSAFCVSRLFHAAHLFVKTGKKDVETIFQFVLQLITKKWQHIELNMKVFEVERLIWL